MRHATVLRNLARRTCATLPTLPSPSRKSRRRCSTSIRVRSTERSLTGRFPLCVWDAACSFLDCRCSNCSTAREIQNRPARLPQRIDGRPIGCTDTCPHAVWHPRHRCSRMRMPPESRHRRRTARRSHWACRDRSQRGGECAGPFHTQQSPGDAQWTTYARPAGSHTRACASFGRMSPPPIGHVAPFGAGVYLPSRSHRRREATGHRVKALPDARSLPALAQSKAAHARGRNNSE